LSEHLHIEKLLLEHSVGSCEDDLRAILGDLYTVLASDLLDGFFFYIKELSKAYLEEPFSVQIADLASRTGIISHQDLFVFSQKSHDNFR
jgi:hypothetical protein